MSPSASLTSSSVAASDAVMPEATFHAIADDCLEFLEEVLEQLDESPKVDDTFDVTNSQGVVTLHLGAGLGTFVINKQSPNRQLWWSSPVSGPKRFYYAESGQWLNTRDDEPMLALLAAELNALVGVQLDLDWSYDE